MTLVSGLHRAGRRRSRRSPPPPPAAAPASWTFAGRARRSELRFWTGAIARVRAAATGGAGDRLRAGQAHHRPAAGRGLPPGGFEGRDGLHRSDRVDAGRALRLRARFHPQRLRRRRTGGGRGGLRPRSSSPTSSSSRASRRCAIPRAHAGPSCWSRPGRARRCCSTPRGGPASRGCPGWQHSPAGRGDCPDRGCTGRGCWASPSTGTGWTRPPCGRAAPAGGPAGAAGGAAAGGGGGRPGPARPGICPPPPRATARGIANNRPSSVTA